MCMIQTVSSKTMRHSFWLCAAALCSLNATAQEPLQWPQTFSGQPDFDYAREEVLQEMQEELSLAGEADSLSTLPKLLRQRVLDPFSGNKNMFSVEQTDIQLPRGLGGDFTLGTTLPQLGAGTSEGIINLEEFKAFITKVLSQKQQIDQELVQAHDFEPDLDKVAIQTIATSPQKYVILNNQRYQEGDRFLLPVKIDVDETVLKNRIDAYMPPAHLVDKETYAKFEEIRDQALEQFKEEQKNAAQKGENIQNVSMTIKSINHRGLTVGAFGKTYTMKLKFRL